MGHEEVRKSVSSQEPETQTCGLLFWEELHVKAHRAKKEKEKMTTFERFVTEGNEKADELGNAGAMLDEGFMAEVRAETMKQEREDVHAAL